MCRLFALSASPHRVHARFWLLDAPDSLAGQSHRNPDGTGLGYFGVDDLPVIDKQPLAAFRDPAFAREARHVSSRLFVSHVRFATTGEKVAQNCHPFAIDGRLFAHNGALGRVDQLEAQLGEDMANVHGETDSERYFALVSKEIRAHDGDVSAGLRAAVTWIAANLPVYSLNCLLATAHELWAFRYPERDRLFVLERRAGGRHGDRDLHYASSALRVHSAHLADRPSVVIASEPLDDSPDWRLLRSGELVHVGRDLDVRSRELIEGRPAHRMLIPVRRVRGLLRDLAHRAASIR
jgi:glutamine amidotransferase